jgi:predicted phage terminase large subunit-like protein
MRNAFDIGKKSIVHFRRVFHPSQNECEPAPFHYEWDIILRTGKKNFAIEAFRESAKSQYVCREFPLYALVYPSVDYNYIVFILATQQKASRKIKEVAEEYLTDPVLSSNLVQVHEQNAAAFDLTVLDIEGNPIRIRFEAYGKGSSVRGLSARDMRPKLVVCDDLQDLEDMKSETTLEYDWEWFLSDIKFLGQYTRIFMIGNNLGEKCIIERIAKDADILGFTFVRLPILNDQGEITWDSKYTLEEIEGERSAYTIMGKLDVWYRERMCLALSPDSQIFKKDDFRYFEKEDVKRKGLSIYITIDLAISQKKTADYTVLLVTGVNSENQWFLLDCVFGRFDPTRTIDELFKLVSKWNPIMVGIEKVAFQAAMEVFIIKEMPKRNIFFRTFGLKAEGKKTERISSLQPRFTSHSVWFPKGESFLVELEKELLSFTMEGSRGLHDDLIDALAYVQQIAIPPNKETDCGEIPVAGAM